MDNEYCYYCRVPLYLTPVEIDHKIPKSRGGGEGDNLVKSCRWCNQIKLDFTPEEFQEYCLKEGYGWPPRSITRQLIEELRTHGQNNRTVE